jgi:hypothetical protein
MPQVDKMIVIEYTTQNSDFKKAAIAVDKLYNGLMNGQYKSVLADFEIETTLRKLHQRIMELDNAVKRSNENEKKLMKEIDKLRIDVTGLKNNLIEFLLMLRNRVNNFNGIYDRTCMEYGLKIASSQMNKSILRWDHLRPDPPTVVGSLQYIEDYKNEVEEYKLNSSQNLAKIVGALNSLGLKLPPENMSNKTDFQAIRSNIDSTLGFLDIAGLCDLARTVSKFFNLAASLFSGIPESDSFIELSSISSENKLKELKIKYTTKGANACIKIPDILPLSSALANETLCIVTNASQISVGFENLEALLTNLKRLDLCLPIARAIMIKISKYVDGKSDMSEKFASFACRIPLSLEQSINYVTTAGVFKNIVKGIEIGMHS